MPHLILKKSHLFLIIVLLVLLALAILASTFDFRFPISDERQMAASGSARDPLVVGDESKVLLQLPTYGINKVWHYLPDGTHTALTDSTAIKNFLVDKLDLSIQGTMDDISGHLGDYSPSVIVLDYETMQSAWPGTELYAVADLDENTFMHAQGLPATRENRVILRDYPSQYLMNPDSAWPTLVANDLTRRLAADTRLDGVFLDNTLAVLNTNGTSTDYANYVRKVTNAQYVSDGTNRIVISGGYKLHTPVPYRTAENPITIYDNSEGVGINYFTGGTYTPTTITLGTATSSGVTLYASYLVLDVPEGTDPVTLKVASWAEPTRQGLAAIKGALGNKLVTFNGIIESWPESYDFIPLSDGGMSEQFVTAPWNPVETLSTLSLERWLAFIDEVGSIAKTKIFFAQAGALYNPATASQAEDSEMRRVAMFDFASFLLAKEKNAYFGFGLNSSGYSSFPYFDYWAEPLGLASGPYAASSHGAGLYERDYASALILVNPSTAAATLTLDISQYDGYWDPFGVWQTSFDSLSSLGAKQGIILTKAGSPYVMPNRYCTYFTYSTWSPADCPASGTQTRTLINSFPRGCAIDTITTPTLSQTCTYVEPDNDDNGGNTGGGGGSNRPRIKPSATTTSATTTTLNYANLTPEARSTLLRQLMQQLIALMQELLAMLVAQRAGR